MTSLKFLAVVAIGRCVVAVAAFAAAGWLASTDHDGWGWLIFAGIVAAPYYSLEIKERHK